MMNQYRTSSGLVVTECPEQKFWIVSDGKRDRKFMSLISFVRYMTK